MWTGSTCEVQAIFKVTRLLLPRRPHGISHVQVCSPGLARSVWLPWGPWSPRHKYAIWTRNMCFPTLTSTSGSEGNQLALLHSSTSEMLFPTLCQIFISHGREALDPYGQSCPSRTTWSGFERSEHLQPKIPWITPILTKKNQALCQFPEHQNGSLWGFFFFHLTFAFGGENLLIITLGCGQSLLFL